LSFTTKDGTSPPLATSTAYRIRRTIRSDGFALSVRSPSLPRPFSMRNMTRPQKSLKMTIIRMPWVGWVIIINTTYALATSWLVARETERADRAFLETGFLNQPPTMLRSAVARLRTGYEADGHRLEEDIRKVLQKKPRLQKKYSRPPTDSDRLYIPDHLYQGLNESCL
ncbi:hypothetical protein N7527_004794, partial [Penicillium freii]